MKIEQKRKKNHFLYGKSGILGDDPSKFARVKTAKRAVWPCVCVYMVWVDGDGFGDGIDDVERCVWVCERVRGAGTSGCVKKRMKFRQAGKVGESPPVHGFWMVGMEKLMEKVPRSMDLGVWVFGWQGMDSESKMGFCLVASVSRCGS